MKTKGLLLLVIWIGVLCASLPAYCKLERFAEPEKLLTDHKAPWTLRADKIEYDRNTLEYIARGNVLLKSDGKLIKADYARFNKKTGVVELEGNVFIKFDGDWARGEKVRWHLESETGFIQKGIVYFSKNHFYVYADKMEKKEGNLFYLENGYITTCNPLKPDWKIDYKSLTVPLKGLAQARGAIFRVGGIPILYVPWGIFPIQEKRQSGFLTPIVGVSKLQGLEIEVPYFWAIDKSRDLTLFGHYFQKRGLMAGAEFRWSTLDWGDGIILANYLHDGADKEHLRDQGVPFQKQDRYWIRGLLSSDFKNGVGFRSKFDFISDRNFLKEFEKGSPSFDYTDKTFRRFLATGILQDKTMSARESNFYLMKLWENSELSLDIHYWDEKDPLLNDLTLQTLPQFELNVAQTRFGRMPFYFEMNSSLSNFWREKGESGTRLRIKPELSYPLKTTYFNITPELGMDIASYNLYQTENFEDNFEYRTVPFFKITADTQLDRTYNLKIWNILSVKHSIRPEIAYEYIPDINQDDIPFFDKYDIIPESNRIRYGFTTFANVKKKLASNSSDSNLSNIAYEEWARLKVFQYYQFIKQSSNIPEDPLSYDMFQNKKSDGFSDIYLELDITPHRFVELSYDGTFSPDEDFVRRHDASLMINTPSGQTVKIDYRYREATTTDEFIVDFSWNVVPWLTVSLYQDYSFDRDEMFKQGYGITYRKNCWAVSVSYEKEGNDRRFFIGLDLLGIGQTALGYSTLSGTRIAR